MSLRKQAQILEVNAGYLSRMVSGKRPWNAEIKTRYEALVGNTSGNTNDIGNTYGANYLTNSNEAIFTNTGIKNMYNGHSSQCGAVAHLGERFNGIEEVESSSLSSSTIVPAVGASLPQVICTQTAIITCSGTKSGTK